MRSPRARVALALVAALDDARARGRCGRPGRRADARRGERGDGRHPEVGVDDVGRLGRPLLAQVVGEGGHVGQQLVLGHVARRARRGRGRPSRRARTATRRGIRGSSRRVCTTTSSPRRPSAAASDATCTFWPPASTPPSTASGLACSDTMAILIDSPPPPGPRPSPTGSARARSARAPRRAPPARAPPPRPGRPTSRRTASGQHVHARRDDAGLRRDRLVHLRRAERDHRHAEVHRLEQREAERGPADRVQVDPPARHLRVEVVLRAGRRWRAARCPLSRLAASIPKRSSGAAREKRSSRSVPVTRARRRASLMTTAARGSSPRVALARVDDAVLDHPRGRRARVPEQRVEVGDVDEQEVVAVGGRMAHLGDPALRRVVLDVDRRHVARPAAGPSTPRTGGSSSCGRWRTHDVERLVAQALRRELASRGPCGHA